MDVNDLRSAVTVASLCAFLALVAWAYSRHRHNEFDEAARLPLRDEPTQGEQA